MFDKLIESNSAEAEFKPRRKFFMVSSVVVGILFLSAVVFSLYAQDIDLGTDDFELSIVVAPVAPDAPEPEPPRQPRQRMDNENVSELPNRPELIARLADNVIPPDTISTVPNTVAEIPLGRFTNNKDLPITESAGEVGPIGNNGGGTGSSVGTEQPPTEVVKLPDPPPVPRAEPKKPVTQSKGVVNGFAIDLPKPPYSPLAKAINLAGSVQVQVLIDESGEVVSARAIDGHAFFKLDAERAAKRAKFRPTYLGDQPVRVTGVIVYRFSR